MYFTSNCFCEDNENMVISCVRDSVENFYLLNFHTGKDDYRKQYSDGEVEYPDLKAGVYCKAGI